MTYTTLNQICVALSLFFVIGTGWVWRGVTFSSSLKGVDSVPSEPYATLVDKNDLAPVSFSGGTTGGEEAPAVVDDVVEPPQGGAVTDLKQLPARINLAVPFTSQAPEKNWDQPWQDACEEAAVLMLDAYYKDYGLSPLFAKDEILRMVTWEETIGWGGSINIDEVGVLATQFTGYPAPRVIENPTVEDIKEQLASGNPVLAVADGKALPNPYFSGEGPDYHALIIRGYTDTHFITNDPGTQHGENFEYTYGDLLSALRDWNDGDVATGRRVVMVLE